MTVARCLGHLDWIRDALRRDWGGPIPPWMTEQISYELDKVIEGLEKAFDFPKR